MLLLVIDQFRYDYLLRFRDQYTGGLSRLLNEGAVFDNAYLERYPTVTAIGHATALTGATPALSGIVGNDWYDRESHKRFSAFLTNRPRRTKRWTNEQLTSPGDVTLSR